MKFLFAFFLLFLLSNATHSQHSTKIDCETITEVFFLDGGIFTFSFDKTCTYEIFKKELIKVTLVMPTQQGLKLVYLRLNNRPKRLKNPKLIFFNKRLRIKMNKTNMCF